MGGAPAGVVLAFPRACPPKVCFLLECGTRGGGAIIAAKGSRGAAGLGEASTVVFAVIVGGGAIGLTRSSGLSPGKTHTFLCSS